MFDDDENDTRLEKDVIAEGYSDFFGNAYIKKPLDEKGKKIDPKIPIEGLTPDDQKE